MTLPLNSLISDWGGFEKLVAKLHETGSVEVQHNVTLVGKSGAPRQIDVLVKHREGLYEHLIIVECKYWKDHVSRLHVDALISTVDELNASRGVIFSINGFQEGAILAAKHAAIDLFQVRELTDQEWGLPGRVVDFYLQVIQGSFGNPVLHDPTIMAQQGTEPKPVSINLQFDEKGPISSTPLLLPNGKPATNRLEKYVLDATHEGLRRFTASAVPLNEGKDGTSYFVAAMNLIPDKPFAIPQDNMLAIVPKISFDLGIKVSQSRMRHDRAEKYLFALAVENCVNGSVSSAARPKEGDNTELNLLPTPNPEPPKDVLVNGSIMRVFVAVMFPFEEMLDKNPMRIGTKEPS
ncbi:MAG: restriction endonuclease [Steroidobacteraceae bacterium]